MQAEPRRLPQWPPPPRQPPPPPPPQRGLLADQLGILQRQQQQQQRDPSLLMQVKQSSESVGNTTREASPVSSSSPSERGDPDHSPRIYDLAVPTNWSELLVGLMQPALLAQLQQADPDGAAIVSRRDASLFSQYMHDLQSFGAGLAPGEELNMDLEPPHCWGCDDYEEALSESEEGSGGESDGESYDWSDEDEETGVDPEIGHESEDAYELIEYEEVPYWLERIRLDVDSSEIQAALRERLKQDTGLRRALEAEEPQTFHAILHASQPAFADFLDAVLDACPVKDYSAGGSGGGGRGGRSPGLRSELSAPQDALKALADALGDDFSDEEAISDGDDASDDDHDGSTSAGATGTSSGRRGSACRPEGTAPCSSSSGRGGGGGAAHSSLRPRPNKAAHMGSSSSSGGAGRRHVPGGPRPQLQRGGSSGSGGSDGVVGRLALGACAGGRSSSSGGVKLSERTADGDGGGGEDAGGDSWSWSSPFRSRLRSPRRSSADRLAAELATSAERSSRRQTLSAEPTADEYGQPKLSRDVLEDLTPRSSRSAGVGADGRGRSRGRRRESDEGADSRSDGQSGCSRVSGSSTFDRMEGGGYAHGSSIASSSNLSKSTRSKHSRSSRSRNGSSRHGSHKSQSAGSRSAGSRSECDSECSLSSLRELPIQEEPFLAADERGRIRRSSAAELSMAVSSPRVCVAGGLQPYLVTLEEADLETGSPRPLMPAPLSEASRGAASGGGGSVGGVGGGGCSKNSTRVAIPTRRASISADQLEAGFTSSSAPSRQPDRQPSATAPRRFPTASPLSASPAVSPRAPVPHASSHTPRSGRQTARPIATPLGGGSPGGSASTLSPAAVAAAAATAARQHVPGRVVRALGESLVKEHLSKTGLPQDCFTSSASSSDSSPTCSERRGVPAAAQHQRPSAVAAHQLRPMGSPLADSAPRGPRAVPLASPLRVAVPLSPSVGGSWQGSSSASARPAPCDSPRGPAALQGGAEAGSAAGNSAGGSSARRVAASSPSGTSSVSSVIKRWPPMRREPDRDSPTCSSTAGDEMAPELVSC